MCAFNLPCTATEQYLYKDACDDGDIGIGAQILDIMKRSNITHKAVFIVRYCGKQKLEENRADAYVQTFKALLTYKPMNTCLQKTQDITSAPRRKADETKTKKMSNYKKSQTPPKSYAQTVKT